MISSTLALLAAAAAQAQDPAIPARQAYVACLRTFTRASLRERKEPAQFETEFESQCTAEQTSLRDALISRDTSRGVARARADEDARMDIEDARANFIERYAMYYEDNTVPE